MTLPYADWLTRQRWYAGRGREIATVEPVAITPLPGDLDHTVLRVEFTDGTQHTYQLVVGWDRAPADEFTGVSLIGDDDGRIAYDALYQDAASSELLRMIAEGRTAGDLSFVPEPDSQFPEHPATHVFAGEQSNTSVIYDTSAILKVYRRLVPGLNPDLELGRALGRAGSPYVAHLLGGIEGKDTSGEVLSLATLSAFAANSADGWSMAAASARDMVAGDELHAEDAGGDFGGEAHRLGEAVASVHATLGDVLGREIARPDVDRMLARLHAAAAEVPELADHVAAAESVLGRATDPTIFQRIHGDLHLGQVLRAPEQWIIIDFEGEPGQPMAERREPDSPMRDVAGMLRSFDYAGLQVLPADEVDAHLYDRAQQWAVHNRSAFCDGYASVAGFDPREHADLLAAYELDKAAYEAAYEARHRPSWRWIPMRSIDRLCAPSGAA
ncbi:MAG TPA: aminoglycoside phosphotransferase [Nocardioidaceae bacterium]|nr:aminoglycoside phosphotransferase [Nocardioidaceae bacterium]